MSQQTEHIETRSIRVIGESEQGRVRIELDGSGDLLGVTFDPRVRRLDSDDLAAAVLSAFQQARTGLRERITADVASIDLTPSAPDPREAELRSALADAERDLHRLTNLAGDFNDRVGRLL